MTGSVPRNNHATRPRFDPLNDRPLTIKLVCEVQRRPSRTQKYWFPINSMFAEHRNLKLCFAVQNVPLHFLRSNRITNVERFNRSDRSRSKFWTLNLPLRDVVQDLYCTDPTQETRARSRRLYGFYSAKDLDDTGQESCGDRSSVRCVKISFALAETTRNTARAA